MVSTFNRKLHRLRQNQILVCMSLSLLAAILLFSFGINGITHSESLDLCKAMALLLHYFLLSSIVWMTIEAYNLYQDLVKVFDTTFISQNEFMCRAGVVGWSKFTFFLFSVKVLHFNYLVYFDPEYDVSRRAGCRLLLTF